MKRMLSLIALAITLFASASCVQTTSSPVNDGKYRLYGTENMWTFLKLDTETGKVWQVHFSLNNEVVGEYPINTESMVKTGKPRIGRFEIYKSKNMFNFLLLDKDAGSVYQVQWSWDEENRGILNVLAE